MKARRLVEGLLVVFLMLMLGSCGHNAAQDECKPNARQVYNYSAHIEIDKELVGYEDIVSIDSEKISGRVVVETSGEPFRIGMMIFNDGQPITYAIDNQEYSYYSFTVGEKSWVDISIDSDCLVEGISKLSVVLLTNEGYYPEFCRDDLKNYSMTMDCSINNTSGRGLAIADLNEPENIEHVSLSEYFQICKDSYVKTYPEMRKYDFTYEEQCLYNLVNNDLDMVFTQDFDLEEARSLSVYRYASQYPESNKTMDIRITGKPGTYYITIFSDGEKYGGFNGMETIEINIAENEMIIVPVSLPSFADLAYSNVFALAFREGDSEHRVYDSAILTTFFTQTEIDFYANQIQTYYNVLYDGKLVTQDPIRIFDSHVKFRFITNQYVTSYYNDYTLLVLVNGVPIEYFIDGQSYVSYDFNCAYGKVDLSIELFPEPATREENFFVEFLTVEKYRNNSFTSPRNKTTAVNKVSVKCLMSDDDSGYFSEGAEVEPIVSKLEISNLSKLSSSGVLRAITEAETYMVTATISNLAEDDEIQHFVLVNDRIIQIDDRHEYVYLAENEYSFQVKIPRDYLHDGMNELHLISTRGSDNISLDTILMVYLNPNSDFEQMEFNKDTFNVSCDENNLYTSVYVNSGVEGTSHFAAMFRSITTRNLWCGDKSVSTIKMNIGDTVLDNRFPIKVIISAVNYNDKRYYFSQQQHVEGTC